MTTPDPVAGRLAAVQLRAENVRECPGDAPDALWRSVHKRSAADVPALLAVVEAVLAKAAEWEQRAAGMDDGTGMTTTSVRAMALRGCVQEGREAISHALLGEGEAGE